MKTSILLLAVVGITGAASDEQPASSSANATSLLRASIQERRRVCEGPSGSVDKWYYQNWSNSPYNCDTIDSATECKMLNAYRPGGQENAHWKYTNDPNDRACLTNWSYYASDGWTFKGVVGRTTTEGGARWCALPVYRKSDVEGKQWAYCSCRDIDW